MMILEVIRNAKTQLQELTGFRADSVSEIAAKENGWEVTANLIELKRIPASTDILAAYRLLLDKDGNIVSYTRVRRYLRDQVMEELS